MAEVVSASPIDGGASEGAGPGDAEGAVGGGGGVGISSAGTPGDAVLLPERKPIMPDSESTTGPQ